MVLLRTGCGQSTVDNQGPLRASSSRATAASDQGLTWSSTVIMKIDLAGPERRGLAMGLNEAAGYLAVAVTALATGYIAAQHGLRPEPFYLGIAYAGSASACPSWPCARPATTPASKPTDTSLVLTVAMTTCTPT